MDSAIQAPVADAIPLAARDRFSAIPIVIGVTGHRDIAAGAEERLRVQFSKILVHFKTKYPSTPLLVLSSLAAGADLLAAEAAIDLDVRVMAVLPKSVERYEADFTDHAWLDRFRVSLRRCWEVVVVEGRRGTEYVPASTYIAYYAHLVVAFWDGESGNHRAGGTGDVVQLRLTGASKSLEASAITYVPDVGPVYQIVTPRKHHAALEHSFEVIHRYPRRYHGDRHASRDFLSALGHLDTYNRDLESFPDVGHADRLEALSERTSQSADRFQTKSRLAIDTVYIAALLAGLAQLAGETIPWLGVKMTLLAVAFVSFLLARSKDYENRYQDYRAISEGLRVQHAWCCAGICNRLAEASYLRMQQGELQWIRLALRTAYLLLGGRDPVEGACPTHEGPMRWLRSQRTYYKRARMRASRNERLFRKVSLVLTLAALVVAGFALIVIAVNWPSAGGNHDLMLALASKPLAAAGLIALLGEFYANKRGFSENVRRYDHMYVVFDHALRRMHWIQKHAGEGDANDLLEQTGCEALAEHANWLVLKRERPLAFIHV